MRRLYRLVLRALPVAVRREYGPEMERVARHCVAVEAGRRGWPGRVWAEVHALADLVSFAVDVRRDARERARGLAPIGLDPHQRRPFLMMRDVTSALRQMRRQPLMTATVVLMLALGIGATTAIFSVVKTVLLTPLALGEPDRIVEIWSTFPQRGLDRVSWAEANTWDLRDLAHSFTSIGIEHDAGFSLTAAGADPERLSGARVSAGFFPALGVLPVAGRFFATGEDDRGAVAERVVISERLWTRRFGRDAGIVGTAIMLDGRPYTVVGVVGDGPVWLGNTDAYVPFIRRGNPNRGSWEFTVIGRLLPGATIASAQADLDGVVARLQQYKDNAGMGVSVNGIENWLAGPDLRRTLWIMLGAVFLLLVIAAVNVTNLLFVRSTARARERAVRTALGARRGDLVREGLAESLLLSALGAAAGWALAAGLLGLVRTQNPGDVPRLANVRLDVAVLLFTMGVTAVVGVATGLMPALRAPFANLVAGLRDGQRGSVGDRTQDRLRGGFVALEVALSVLLLVGAALLVRSLQNVLSNDRGFATENRLTAEIGIPSAYGDEKRETLAQELLDRIGRMPEIVAVGAVNGAMLAGGGTGMNFAAASSTAGATEAPWATWRVISKGYFDAMGLHLVAGRNVTEHDLIGKPWRVVISQRLANEIWPGRSAVGQTAVLWNGQSNDPAEVIGVVSDLREHRLDDAPTREVYLPAYGGALGMTTLRLVMHTRGNPDAAAEPLRAAVKSVDATLPVSRVRSVEALVDRSVATRRFTMRLLALFAGIAAVLALAGVAGVLAFAMSRRRGEMGLRLALGAQRGQLLSLAVRMGLTPVVAGLAGGLGLAFWLSRLMTSLLYGVTASDPLTYAAVSSALLAAAALACYLPARRVLAIDPATALRAD